MKQTGIKLVFSKDFYKAMLIYSAILPEAISFHISILILINEKRYNRSNEKIYKVSGKMQYILIYIRCQGQKPETTMCLHRSGFMA